MDLVQKLTETRDRTVKYFELSDEDLNKTYEPGKWSVKRILVHIADAESVLHDRVRRIIAEPRGVIWAFDQDLWCKNLDYDHFPIKISKDLYIANRQSAIYLAEKYYANLGHLEFVHSETGLRTLSQEFEKIASHNESHLNQIEKALMLKR